jgi:hypothetical protein
VADIRVVGVDTEGVNSSAIWQDDEFWNRLSQLESEHQRIHAAHEHARRNLERVKRAEVEELQKAWRIYRDVLAELDRTTAAIDALCEGPPMRSVAACVAPRADRVDVTVDVESRAPADFVGGIAAAGRSA